MYLPYWNCKIHLLSFHRTTKKDIQIAKKIKIWIYSGFENLSIGISYKCTLYTQLVYANANFFLSETLTNTMILRKRGLFSNRYFVSVCLLIHSDLDRKNLRDLRKN